MSQRRRCRHIAAAAAKIAMLYALKSAADAFAARHERSDAASHVIFTPLLFAAGAMLRQRWRGAALHVARLSIHARRARTRALAQRPDPDRG